MSSEAELPPGWRKVWESAYERFYYYNEATRESRWERPHMDDASAPPPGPPPELERYGPAGGQRRTERSQEGQYKEDSYGGGRGDLAPRQDDRRDGYGRRDDGAGRSNNNYRDDRDRGTAPQGGDYRRRDSREPAYDERNDRRRYEDSAPLRDDYRAPPPRQYDDGRPYRDERPREDSRPPPRESDARYARDDHRRYPGEERPRPAYRGEPRGRSPPRSGDYGRGPASYHDPPRGRGYGGGQGGPPRERRKVFVGGLPWGATNDSIAKAFAPCGEVVDIKIVRDREDPSKSKGYGFVTFSNGDGARSAVDTMQGYMLDGRSIRVEFPERDDMDMDKGYPRGGGGGFRGEFGTSEGYGSDMGGENASGVAKIYVGSLDFQIREKDLIEEFKKCGEVVDAKVLMDRNDRTRSRGYGFVTFADSAGAQKALAEMDGVALRGRRIKVGLATDPRRRDGGEQGMGGDRGGYGRERWAPPGRHRDQPGYDRGYNPAPRDGGRRSRSRSRSRSPRGA